jgi:DNA-binding CsgD family transcriptional regulator
MTTVSAADHRRILEFVWTAHQSDDLEPFPERVLAELRALLPSAVVAFHQWGSAGGYRWIASGVDRASLDKVWAGYDEVIAEDPIPGGAPRHGARVAPPGLALKISDFLTLRQFRRLDLHAEMCRPFGVDYVMKLYLRTGSSGASIVLDRDGRDFSERDRSVLNTLAPHLDLVWRRHVLRQPRPSRATETLTPREQDVLDLVAAGWTNREIGAMLFIAPGTVRKHLDNTYAKLGVRSRAQAVAVARGAQIGG